MKFVLVALCDYGRVFPSMRTLADKVSQDVKTVRKNMARLLDMGLIQPTGERKGRTKQIPVYTLNIKKIEELALIKDYQKRESLGREKRYPLNETEELKTTKNGTPKTTKNGSLKDYQKRYPEPLVVINRKSEPEGLQEGPPKQELILQSDTALTAHQKSVGKKLAPTAKTWKAYSTAYRDRYGVLPIRNAKVNGILANFIKRVPIDEAPDIAAFYLSSANGYYVGRGHCVDCLLSDAEKLRMEWATNHRMTQREAKQLDSMGGLCELSNKISQWNEARNG